MIDSGAPAPPLTGFAAAGHLPGTTIISRPGPGLSARQCSARICRAMSAIVAALGFGFHQQRLRHAIVGEDEAPVRAIRVLSGRRRPACPHSGAIARLRARPTGSRPSQRRQVVRTSRYPPHIECRGPRNPSALDDSAMVRQLSKDSAQPQTLRKGTGRPRHEHVQALHGDSRRRDRPRLGHHGIFERSGIFRLVSTDRPAILTWPIRRVSGKGRTSW